MLDVITCVDRLDLGCHLRAHAGADTVAADQDVDALAAAVSEVHDHA
jgi:hypothetical protein